MERKMKTENRLSQERAIARNPPKNVAKKLTLLRLVGREVTQEHVTPVAGRVEVRVEKGGRLVNCTRDVTTAQSLVADHLFAVVLPHDVEVGADITVQ